MADELEAVVRAAPDDAVVLVAEATGQVVSAGRVEFMAGHRFRRPVGGATLKAWRGRGIYRALVAARARLALARRIACSRSMRQTTAGRSWSDWASTW